MKVKSESEVAESCPTLRDHMDCSLPGSSIHGIFQARVLEWGAIALSSSLAAMVQVVGDKKGACSTQTTALSFLWLVHDSMVYQVWLAQIL